MLPEIEVIPDEDEVARHIEQPRMVSEKWEFVWKNIFTFPGGRPESVVWRKYAISDQAVFELGLRRMAYIREHRRPGARYVGFIAAQVFDIRDFRSTAGHGFRVEHAPEEGIEHAHIHLWASENGRMTRSHKDELIFVLSKMFNRFIRCIA